MVGGWRAALMAMLALSGCLGGGDAVEPASVNGTITEDPETAPADGLAPEANATTAAPLLQVDMHVTSTGFYPVNPAFESDTSEIPTGAVVTVTYHNEDLNPLGKHDWVLEGVEGASTAMIEVGEEAMGRFVAPAPGEYAYFCSVEGHRGAGMEGTLTIV